ncbi:hypothetical protein [Lactococcus petauri]|uniref:hypothetical protein n=1 Tax=Lactococcus petauri TaxID=1940789 RepID=UPI001F575BD5|nr:hypothetical protein [Lactococcus petauri]
MILLLIVCVFYFLSYKTLEKETLDYERNHYYAATYITPNLSTEGKETTIFGEATYIGCYKNRLLNLNTSSKLWSIHPISQKKLIVEMTPNAPSSTVRVWTNKKLKTPKEAFDFLNPTYLTYGTYNNGIFKFHQIATEKQKEISHTVRKIISHKPSFTKTLTINGEAVNEIYFNENVNQSLVLQASLVKAKDGKVYMVFSGHTGKIDYWEVSEELLKLLR